MTDAADFANALDDAQPEAREALIRGVLIRTIDATGYLTEAEEAVAAAALVTARTESSTGNRPTSAGRSSRSYPSPKSPPPHQIRPLRDRNGPLLTRTGENRKQPCPGRGWTRRTAAPETRQRPSDSATGLAGAAADWVSPEPGPQSLPVLMQPDADAGVRAVPSGAGSSRPP
ncbi:DUF4259 domain-containing protein [Streptomyces sp. NPDC004266]|uniref:DUF4259 domain-containing protein n=1 Tax=Streptomyces sp. NPDC004266 TaxID=3364693 RepID=UPI003699EB90